MTQKLKKFLLLDFKQKCLLLEAFIFLARGRYLKLLPFAKVAPSLGQESKETFKGPHNHENIVRDVAYAIQTMSKYTFWESACLVQGIAATRMLNRRNIETTLYLGIARDREGIIHAHAWVRSGSIYVTGERIKNNFTVVNTFASGLKNRGERDEGISSEKNS